MTDDLGTPVRARLRAALPSAIKSRDRAAVAALRSALGAIDNAEAVDVAAGPATSDDGPVAHAVLGAGAGDAARRDLSEAQVADIVRGEIAERRAAADGYDRAGHPEQAARLRAEADVLEWHLAG